ncbi:MAG: k9ap1 [Myxococcaceae bacterium]|nr:k9ap1 [Myxococcaceae bacterium]
MPSNPKRSPPRKGELPFDDAEILQADDPRPQRVPQYPATSARRALKKVEEHIPTSVFDTEQHDQELRATYGSREAQKPAFLYVERGPGAGQLVELKPGPLVIGRASVSDLRLQHPSISRRHAQFKRIGEQFFVKDLGSQNGTFVNKNKIETEIEVFPGDLIAMGNALLKLRGPLTKGEALPAPSRNKQVSAKKAAMKTSIGYPATHANPVPSKKSSSMVKVAIFAGAMGFGLAGVLAFALVQGVGTKAPSKVGARGAAKAAEPEIDIAVDDVKVQQNKKVDEAISKRMQEKQAATAAIAAEKKAAEKDSEPAEAAPAEDRRPRPIVARATSPSKKAAEEDDSEEAAAPKAASPSAKKAAILAPYEKGNAEGSLEAAKKANDRELTTKLTEFISVYEAADNAVNSNNGGAAIKNFEKALKLDEQLSSGWGVYGGKIRKQLANLYTLVGLQHVKNDATDNAKIAFQAALKNDPENERAKAQLARLGGTAKADEEEEEKPVAKKKAAAPAKKTAAEPKSRSQAIDDAFGD